MNALHLGQQDEIDEEHATPQGVPANSEQQHATPQSPIHGGHATPQSQEEEEN